MATQVANPVTAPAPANTVDSQQDITSEIKTFARVVFVTGKDEKTSEPTYASKIINEKAAEDIEKSVTPEAPSGLFEGKQVFSLEKQSFVQYAAKSDAGWRELISDEGERAAMCQRGASQKQDNKARQWLSATDDDGKFLNPITGQNIDQKAQLQEITNRRLSPFEKLMADFQEITLTPDMKARLAAMFAQRSAEEEGA